MSVYIKGQAIRLTGTFKDVNGALAAPGGVVTLRVYDNTGALNLTVTSGTLNNPSTGVYYYDFATVGLAEGYWKYAFSSAAGSIAAAGKGTFQIVGEAD